MHKNDDVLAFVALRDAQLTFSGLSEELGHYFLGKPLVGVKLYE